MKKTFSLIILLVILTCSLFAQATMTQTILSVALTATGTSLTVASATGIYASGVNQEVVTELVIDKEALGVRTISGLVVGVQRGFDGTRPTPHASGATVWVGPPNYFSSFDPSGGCTSTLEPILPKVVTTAGRVWGCGTAGVWELFPDQHSGLAPSGVTAVEIGGPRDHVTELDFTAVLLGAPGTNGALAVGKLLYTLPAGAVVVKASYMSVAVNTSVASCHADTPDVGVGTTIGSGAHATLDDLSSAAENILTGQTAGDANGTATVKTISNQILPIEATGDHTVYINAAVNWSHACTVTATGTVVLDWAFLK